MKKENIKLKDLVTCTCGLVWNLEQMKFNQFDFGRRYQLARCRCGTRLYNELEEKVG